MTPRLQHTLSFILLIWMLLLAGNAFSQNYPDGYARTYQFIEKELFQKLNEWSEVSLGDVTIMSEAEKESHKNKVQTKRIFLMEHTINYSNTNVKISDEICNASGKKWWSFYTDLVDWELPFHCEFVSAELNGRHEDGLWYYVTYNINYIFHKNQSTEKHYTGTMTSDFVKKSLTVHDYMYITDNGHERKLDRVADKLPDGVEKLVLNKEPVIVEVSNNSNTPNYLCFTAQTPNSSIGIKSYDANNPDIQYSIDGGKTWNELKEQEPIVLRNIGDKMLVKGNNPDGFSKGDKGWGGFTSFKMKGKIAASGNIMSLIDGKGETLTIKGSNCFWKLFENCKSLTSAPELPATNLSRGCYRWMFQGCTNLTSPPKLPATNLALGCYEWMFSDCTSLTTAPELPANKLAINCYAYMFKGCSSLTSAPELPATKLDEACYSFMFSGCTKLKSIKVNFYDWRYNYYLFSPTENWMKGVARHGTFYCPHGLDKIPTKGIRFTYERKVMDKVFDESHIPKGWTVIYID